jgi:multidrug efflux pump subunit AcrA (membrane-fusion protein)
MTNWVRAAAYLCLALVVAGCEQVSQTDKKTETGKAKTSAAAPAAAVKPPTHKVEKGPFKIDVTLKGVFEAAEMTEIALSPEAWTPDTRGMLTVKKAVEHGKAVKKGDLLLTLDLEKIDQAIRDLEGDLHLSDVANKQAEEELPVLEKSTPLDLALAERGKKLADEDLKKFLEVDRPLSVKSANFTVKSAEHYLEYAKEELRQLEKMYRANDLREETEEIILKRQRHAVESAAFSLESSKIRRDQTLNVDLPRQEQTLKERVVRDGLSLDKAKSTLPLALSQKRVALEKAKYEHAKSADRLHKLQKDREMMTVKAPADGVAYYGKCVKGHWTTAATVGPRLQMGGVLMPDEVILTLVKPRPLFVRAVVEEKDLRYIRPGLQGKVQPVIDPEQKLPAHVEQVAAVPETPGTFDARIHLDSDKEAAALMPGMACTVKFVVYQQAAALTVPAAAVFAEELDEDKHFVYVVDQAGMHTKRSVAVGKTADGRVEILSGLREGDEILQTKPAAGK